MYAHISLQIPRKMHLITQIFIFTDYKTHLQFTIYHCNIFYQLNMNVYVISYVRFYICQRGPFPKGCSTCALNLQLIQMLKWSHRNKRGRVRCKMKGTWTLITEKYIILRWSTAPQMESEISEIVNFWRILGLWEHPLAPICTPTLFLLL